eukprot:GEZU01030037.1.p1 GENE.GEZU01030037.1~~GEZU01030037.1.p1  ORF type:complete len:343 (-),score=155.52 GEZU01030037.1:256-1284(-)
MKRILFGFVATIVVLSFACQAYALRVRYAEEIAQNSFRSFMHRFNKQYDTQEEFNLRFANFKATLARIAQKNAAEIANGNEAIYGITKFADMSPEEFKARYLMPNYKKTAISEDEKDVIEPPKGLSVPESFDWRPLGAVTPVKDQEQCGSCWAFSVTENIESMWIRAGKGTNHTVDLSPQQIVDCDTEDDGCNGGDPPTAYKYVINAGGLESEKSYPYKGVDGTCKFKKSEVVAKISGWKYATKNNDEDTMQANLVAIGPLSICVDAESWQDYTHGVVTRCGTNLDHCVQVVGYDTKGTKPYWIVRNSWNTDWGVDGYIYVEMGKNVCGIAEEVTTAEVSHE